MFIRRIINAISSSVSIDPYFNKVVLLLNCDGTNGSTSFSDLSLVPKNITVNNASVSTSTKKFGTGSMMCTQSTSSYVKADYSPDFNFGSGDFTVECWAYFTSSTSFQGVFSINVNTGTTYGSLRLETYNSNLFYVLMRSSGSSSWINSSTGFGSYTINTWIHLAVVRYGTQITLYCNGVGYPCFSLTGAIDDQQGPAYFGWSNNGSFNGYIDDCRITKGIARYTSNFTPPVTAFPTTSPVISPTTDPLWNNVLLAITGDGSNGSISFTDKSTYARNITPSGNAQVSTSNKIAGTGSIYLDGAGDYLTIPSNSSLFFGTSDFTIEMWYKPVSRIATSATYPGIISNMSSTNWAANGFELCDRHAGYSSKFSFLVYNYNSGSAMLVSTTSVLNNVWYHIAICRSGSAFTLYINGVSESTATYSGAVDNQSQPWTIGVSYIPNGDYINGYIDNLRVTKGIARYTSNFTPAPYQLPVMPVNDMDWSLVSLLVRGNGTNGTNTIIDESNNNIGIYVAGNTQISTSIKKYGTGSIYFDGAGDYLTISANSALLLGSSDFTIELWYYPTGRSNQYASIVDNGSTAGSYTQNTFFLYDAHPNAPTKFSVMVYNYNNVSSMLISTTTVALNQWYHIAICRSANILTMYINGIAEATATFSGSVSSTSYPWSVGGWASSTTTNIQGYIDDFRVTNGLARYTANFIPPTYQILTNVSDYFFSSVELLLNGDGTNGSTTFTDLSYSPKSISIGGTVTVNTATKKFGTGSIYFNGSSYLTHTTITMAGDFTIEAWVNRSAVTGGNRVLYSGPVGWVGWSSNTTFVYSTSTATGIYTISDTTNRWAHYAIVKDGTTVRVYIDGVAAAATATETGSFVSSEIIGQNSGYLIACYIDDLRITKGIARYTSTFTPPTSTLPSS